MRIEVTPISGTHELYTVTLGGYRLALVANQDQATQVANQLRKGVNRSGGRKPRHHVWRTIVQPNLLDTLSV
jgi:hypothetical protein